jgi:hypothetical protein
MGGMREPPKERSSSSYFGISFEPLAYVSDRWPRNAGLTSD